MDKAAAQQFANEWINAWNAHDVDRILSHYADDITFTSPLVAALNFNESGTIHSKDDLRRYFETGLNRYPDLHFQLHNCLSGVNTLVLYYQSVNNMMAAEVFELDGSGKVMRVYCNYSSN